MTNKNLLNEAQREAVETTEGAVLVLAGAGSGKTRVLVSRIAHILYLGLAAPWQILALTFTNKAANEMKNRLAGYSESLDWVGTFHSVCLRILRRNAQAAGLGSNFIILGEDEQKSVLKSVITNLGLDVKEYEPAAWVDRISSIKDKGLGGLGDGGRVVPGPASNIYAAYNEELKRLNAVDFGDLILKTLYLFEREPEILEKYQRQFKYILVDEFQDTNAAQFQLLTMLASGKDNANICCVGDDDQSIYSWRGAQIRNILDFEKIFPGAKIIRLETNYRSTPNILGAANSLIKHNTGRMGKDLRPAPGAAPGDKVRIVGVQNDLAESSLIADMIEAGGKSALSEVAVLIRAGSLSRSLEKEFGDRGIPYKLVGGTKFYDRMEVRDAIAYARLLVYPFDDLSFVRIISKPRRGFGEGAIAKLRSFGGGLMSTLHSAPLSGKQREAADEFIRAFDFDWRNMSPKDAVSQILENSGYMKIWRESKEPDAESRLENIGELLNEVAQYDTLEDFLEHAALRMTEEDGDKNSNEAVSIMTMHAAKGLEFDTVFLPAWEEGIFPNDKSVKEGGLEEERRLAYVAVTRAKKRCMISMAASRYVFGKPEFNLPSRFISEIEPQYTETMVKGAENIRLNNLERKYSPPRAQKRESWIGKLVTHQELGGGVVIEDNGEIVTVAFKNKGIKKVDRRFLKV